MLGVTKHRPKTGSFLTSYGISFLGEFFFLYFVIDLQVYVHSSKSRGTFIQVIQYNLFLSIHCQVYETIGTIVCICVCKFA